MKKRQAKIDAEKSGETKAVKKQEKQHIVFDLKKNMVRGKYYCNSCLIDSNCVWLFRIP